MDIHRRSFVGRLAAYGAIALGGRQGDHRRRIGLAFGDDPEGGVAAFREALRQRGYVEGVNLVIEAREGSNGATELAHMNVELVVVHSLPLALATRQANPAKKMVIVTTPGMVINGFAKTLQRPGGTVTGIDELPAGIVGARLELLKAVVPSMTRVALLSTTPGRAAHEAQLADAQQAADRLGVSVKGFLAANRDELEAALAAIAADQVHGLVNFQGALSYINRQLITAWAAQHKVPAIYQATVFAAAGGLMTWAPDLVDQFRAAADYVDQILKGADPGELPIRHPSKYYLTLNKRAAGVLGIAFPPALVAKADRVID